MRTLLVGGVLLLGGCDLLFTLTRVDVVDARTVDAPTDSSFDPAVCPETYSLSVDATRAASRYRHLSASSWVEAATACAADLPGSTHLIVISSDHERRGLVQSSPARLWIGLSDRVQEGMFRWVTSEPAPVPAAGYPWAANQPDDFNGNQDCVNIRVDSGVYDDSECDGQTQLGAVCECDGFPDEPSHYTPN